MNNINSREMESKIIGSNGVEKSEDIQVSDKVVDKDIKEVSANSSERAKRCLVSGVVEEKKKLSVLSQENKEMDGSMELYESVPEEYSETIRFLDNNEKDFKVFVGIFKEFEGEPFNEKWTMEQMRETFNRILETGKIFCYFKDKGSKEERGLGLGTLMFAEMKSNLLSYDEFGKFIYFSDVIVLKEERNKSIGSKLIDCRIEYARLNKIDTIYVRTNFTESMVEPLLLRRGFEVIRDTNGQIITEEVPFLRQDGCVKTDKRKYLIKKL